MPIFNLLIEKKKCKSLINSIQFIKWIYILNYIYVNTLSLQLSILLIKYYYTFCQTRRTIQQKKILQNVPRPRNVLTIPKAKPI